jgi:hypothetical protein
MISNLVRRFGGRLGDPGATPALVAALGMGVLVAVRHFLISAWLLGFR